MAFTANDGRSYSSQAAADAANARVASGASTAVAPQPVIAPTTQPLAPVAVKSMLLPATPAPTNTTLITGTEKSPFSATTSYNPDGTVKSNTYTGQDPTTQPALPNSPWLQNGTTDKNALVNYVPTNDQLLNPPAEWTPEQRNILFNNYYKSKGIDTGVDSSTLPTSSEEAGLQAITEANKKKSLLDSQADYQIEQYKRKLGENVAGTNAALPMNREGVSAPGNAATAGVITTQYQNETGQQIAQLTELKRQYQLALQSGNLNSIKALGQAVAQTNQAINDSQTKQLENTRGIIDKLAASGELSNISSSDLASLASTYNVPVAALKSAALAATTKSLKADQKEQFANISTAANTAFDFMKNGQPISLNMAQQLSNSTKVPAMDWMNFNQRAQDIAANNKLDDATKAQQFQGLQYDITQKLAGIASQEDRNWQTYNKMKDSGTFTPVELQDFVTSHNMDVTANPKTQAELAVAQANAVIKNVEAQYAGKPPPPGTLEDVKYQQAKADLAKSQYENVQSGATNVNTTTVVDFNGKQYQGYQPNAITQALGIDPEQFKAQCGRLVNQATGIGVGDTYQNKMEHTDPSIKAPQAGMVFVMPTSEKWGHTGIVAGVSDDGKTVLAYDANWNNKSDPGGLHTHEISTDKITGYALPKSGSALDKLVNPPVNKANVTNSLQSLADSIAHYNIDPKDLSSRLPKGATESERAKVLQMAKEINPEFSEGKYGAKKAFIDAWEGAPTTGTYAFMNNSANTAIKHLETAYNAFQEIKNSGVKDANGLINYLKDHAGDPAISAFMSIQEPLAGELGKASTGGVPNEGEMANYRKILDVNKSPDAMLSTLKSQMDLIGGKIKTNVNQYKRSVGTLPADSVLDDESIAALKRIGLNPNSYDPTIKEKPSEVVQNFMNDPNASEADKNALQNDLKNPQFSSDPNGWAERAIRRHYGTKYDSGTYKAAENPAGLDLQVGDPEGLFN